MPSISPKASVEFDWALNPTLRPTERTEAEGLGTEHSLGGSHPLLAQEVPRQALTLVDVDRSLRQLVAAQAQAVRKARRAEIEDHAYSRSTAISVLSRRTAASRSMRVSVELA
ncbi:MAG: hypothetical protein MZW92_41235 [Comamonadaceae bacterium]|nr:hypothetical protein [Comamonadaceae bacterium]